MADLKWQKRLNDMGYKNWLKVSLALIESKEALHDFVENVIKSVHNRIKTKVGSGVCTKTSACNTNKGTPSCSSCSQWVKEIKAISGGMLNWKNADPHNWHNKPWEIAKCFMNPQGSKATAAANTGPDKTDLSGILNVLVNCKEFKSHLNVNKLPENVRTVRNELMHCATMSFNDAEMQTKIDTVIALLEDEKELKNLPSCREKVKLIKSLRDSDFQLKPEDEGVCIESALKSPEFSGEMIDEESRPLLDKLLELIKGDKNLREKFEFRVSELEQNFEDFKERSEVRFSNIDDALSEMKRELEIITEDRKNGRSISTNTRSALGIHGKTWFKNALQNYAQMKKIDLPDYKSNIVDGGKFVSVVVVDGKKFKSEEPKLVKKEAEQSAAEVALMSLVLR